MVFCEIGRGFGAIKTCTCIMNMPAHMTSKSYNSINEKLNPIFAVLLTQIVMNART